MKSAIEELAAHPEVIAGLAKQHKPAQSLPMLKASAFLSTEEKQRFAANERWRVLKANPEKYAAWRKMRSASAKRQHQG